MNYVPGLLFASVVAPIVAGQLSYDQVKLYSPDPKPGAYFGEAISICDLNHDGFGDAIIVERSGFGGGEAGAGRLWIAWGPTLGVLKKVESRSAESYEYLGYGLDFPRAMQVVDVNGDGALDLVVPALGWSPSGGYPPGFCGRVHIFLGPKYGEELLLQDPAPEPYGLFGTGILAHDLDGDGFPELIIGAPRASGWSSGTVEEGRVWLFAGSDLARGVVDRPTLLPFPDAGTRALFGWSIRAADHDNDGIEDLWIGAREKLAGAIYVFGGNDLNHIATIEGPLPFTWFSDLRHFEDVSGDGVPDAIVSAPGDTIGAVGSEDLPGVVLVLRGPELTDTLAVVEPPLPEESEHFGAKTEVVDVDADGDLDIVIGDRGDFLGQPSAVRIFHGPSFTVLQSLTVEDGLQHPGMGWEVATGDIDGDGLPEVLAGSYEQSSQGMVTHFSPRTLTASAPSLSVAAGGLVNFWLRIGPGVAGDGYYIVVGGSGTGQGIILGPGSWLPLQPDLLTEMGMSLLIAQGLMGPQGLLDEDGAAQFLIQWPPGFAPSLVGLELTVAAITTPDNRRPGACSSAVTIELLP